MITPRMSGELRVGSKYRLGRKLGSGSFGEIHLGRLGNNKTKSKLFLFLELIQCHNVWALYIISCGHCEF